MGYMGSGLQRWIYTQRPRKFFSKERTNPGNSFDIGADSGTKVAGRAGKPSEARKRVNEYFERNRQARYISLMALLGILMMAGGLAYDLYHAPTPKYSREDYQKAAHQEAVAQRNAEEQQNAYLLLLNSGDEHFRKRQFEWAIEEYSKAAEIFPKATEPAIRIARSYKYLCAYYGQNCAEAEAYKLWLR
ncbi:MAG: hypothetical protein KDD19_24015 [Phaeodactylibacter sp.]|nr:hypothetical protein [Phaeodactylibacter sp.]MCB9048359.1 hypothetical protein [Lewinellaceae bacterium]